ncbi:cytochrome P450 [Streptomyces sp. CT34]|uniref:cytochrome P450 n=1 Tax=Streptomyces sp. CT34 TaxID=1553907 RepID=UPI0005BB2BCD|nr:cytochrome P450 [Streptomyces sp. CT34]
MTKPMDSIPTAPGALPLIGHLVPLLRDPLAFFTSLPSHGRLVRIRIGGFVAVVVCDQDLTRQVLREDQTFDKGGPFMDQFKEMIGDGLPVCPHSRHRRQRRLVQPVFHSGRLPGYAHVLAEQAAAVTRSWQDGQVLDVRAEMMALTARGTLATMFSDSLPSPLLRQTVGDLATVLTDLTWRALRPPSLGRLPTPGNRRFQQSLTRLRRTIDGIIADRRASGADHGDLLSALLSTRDVETDGWGLSDTEVTDQVVTFFVGGTETSATNLSWALHLLASHSDIRQRLYAEADRVLDGRPAVYADLPRLELARNVVTEALRLWPPVGMFTRTVTSDTRLDGHAIPADATVIYSPYLIHHRPDLYPHPDLFDPDRWRSARTPPRDAFIPFGGGARKCIGDKFAMIFATLVLATIAARWDLRPVPDGRVRPALGTILTPRGLRMRAIARTKVEVKA